MSATKPRGSAIEMPGRHQRPLPRRQRHVDGGVEVGPGVTRVGVGRQRQVGVEAHDRDVEVGEAGRAAGRARAVNLPANGVPVRAP